MLHRIWMSVAAHHASAGSLPPITLAARLGVSAGACSLVGTGPWQATAAECSAVCRQLYSTHRSVETVTVQLDRALLREAGLFLRRPWERPRLMAPSRPTPCQDQLPIAVDEAVK